MLKLILKESIIPIRSDVDTYQKYAAESMAISIEKNKVYTDSEIEQEKKRNANEWKEKGNSFVKLKDYESAS